MIMIMHHGGGLRVDSIQQKKKKRKKNREELPEFGKKKFDVSKTRTHWKVQPQCGRGALRLPDTRPCSTMRCCSSVG